MERPQPEIRRESVRDLVSDSLAEPAVGYHVVDGNISSSTVSAGGGPLDTAAAETFAEAVRTAFVDAGAVADAAKNGEHHAGVLAAADGSALYYHVGGPIAQERATGRVELFREVTAALDAYERMELFETLVAEAQDGLVVLDGNHTITFANDSFADMVDRPHAAVEGTDLGSLVAESARDRLHTTASAVASGSVEPQVVDLPVDRAETSGEAPLAVHLAPREGAGVDGLIAIARDQRQRIAREQRLERYQTLVESATDPMAILDTDGTVLVSNAALAAAVGKPQDSLKGTRLGEVLADPARGTLTEAISTVAAEQETRRCRVSLPGSGATSTRRQYAAICNPAEDDGQVTGVVATFRDITEQAQKRREIDQRRALFGDIIAQAVEQTLAEVESVASDLGERVEPPLDRSAETIASHCAEFSDLTGKSRLAERILEEDPVPERHSLSTVTRSGVANARDRFARGSVAVDLPADITVRAIPAIDLAIENLVENALEHGGSDPTVWVTASVAEAELTLTVADDGPGISSDELAVLERGVETPLEHGSGVGLWLIDWIVDKSGGSLSFDVDGTGTRARITLPRAQPAAAVSATNEDTGPQSVPADGETDWAAASVRVLLVARDDRVRQWVREARDAVEVSVGIRTVSTVADAAAILEESTVDCLVSERFDQAWPDLRAAVTQAGVPHILYASGHADTLAADRYQGIDSFVEQSGPASAAFLLSKVVAITGADDDPDDGGGQSPRERLAADIGLAVHRGRGGERGEEILTTEGMSFPRESATEREQLSTAPLSRITHEGSDRLVAEESLSLPLPGAEDEDLVVSTDLTALVERAWRASVRERLIERAEDGVSVVDANGIITYHNQSFAELLGYDDMVGTHAGQYMAPGELEKGQRAVQRILSTPGLNNEVLDLTMLTADSTEITIGVHYAVRLTDGEYDGLLNVARDVTERKARERRLDQYRSLVESSTDPMFALDEDGTVVLANEALGQFAGMEREGMIGSDLETVLDEAALKPVRDTVAAVTGGDPASERTTVWVPTDSGPERCYDVRVTDLSAPGMAGAACTFRDITTRQRRAQELTLLKEVLGRVLRHNLRNEVTVLLGHASELSERTSGRAAELAETVRTGCQTLTQTAEAAQSLDDTMERTAGTGGRACDDVLESVLEDVETEGEWTVIMAAETAVTVPAVGTEALQRLLEGLTDAGADGGRLIVEPDSDGCTVTVEATGIDCGSLLPDDRHDGALDPGTSVDARVAWWLLELCDGRLETSTDSLEVWLPATTGPDDAGTETP
jgi:PAS domain S-box-containing protein